MLSLLIILILAYGVYIGSRRGFMMQLFYTVGYLISFIISLLLSHSFGPKLDLIVPYPSATPNSYFAFFNKQQKYGLDKSFYFGVAILIILIIGWAIVRVIATYFDDLTFYPMSMKLNYWGGGIMGFITNYVGIFVVLFVVALIPVSGLQHMLAHSWLSSMMIKYSIGLTNLFNNLLIGIH